MDVEALPPAPPIAVPPADRDAMHRHWLASHVDPARADVMICRCEEVGLRDLLGVRPPRYLSYDGKKFAGRDLRSLAADGPINQDQIKRLTRAGMGACQGRRCREQVQVLLAMQGNQPTGSVPLPSYRAPLRPLPLNVLSAHDETQEMRDNWVVWFGIPGQWLPQWEPVPDRAAVGGRVARAAGIRDVSAGASVVVIGGGATGLSTAWWLRREGVPVTVVEKGIVGWEASGRNGGGATHPASPLFREEQRLWPMMDELLGYPTEHQPMRDQGLRHAEPARTGRAWRGTGGAAGVSGGAAGPAGVARAGAVGRRRRGRRDAVALWRPRQSAADGAGLCLGDPGPGRHDPAAHHGDRHPRARRQGGCGRNRPG